MLTPTSKPTRSESTPTDVRHHRRLDRVTLLGMALTGLAAAIASASALAGLAAATGWMTWSSWLLPASVDVLAAVAIRVWLDPTTPGRARRFARLVTIGAVLTSMAGNAAGHLVEAGHLTVTWPLIVFVGAIPAAALGVVVELHALRTAETTQSESTTPTGSAPDSTESTESSRVRSTPADQATTRETSTVPESAQSTGSGTPRSPRISPTVVEAPRVGRRVNGHTARPEDIEQLRALIAAGDLPEEPSATAIREHLGISSAYARAARDALRGKTLSSAA